LGEGDATTLGAGDGVVVAHLSLDGSWGVAMWSMTEAFFGQLT